MNASPSDRTRLFFERFRATDAPRAPVEVEISAKVWTETAEITAALMATLLLRLDSFAPSIRLRLPSQRNRALPRLPDGPLIEALAHEHAGFASIDRLSGAPASKSALRYVIGGSAGDGISVDVAGWRARTKS